MAISPLFLTTKDYNRQTSSLLFEYFRCPSCQLIFLQPIPEDLGAYYPQEYYQIPSSAEELALQSIHEKYKVDLLKKFISKGTLLEIGPATGGFAYWAQQEGFTVEVMEQDPRCCQFLSKTLNIPTVQGSDILRNLPNNRTYEVIALWHVLEHLPSPWSVLNELVRRLHVGGFLSLALPNPNALQFKLLQKFWAHLDAPRHTQLIPIELLTSYLEKLGCRVKLQTTTDEGSLHWNQFGWYHSLPHILSSTSYKKILTYGGKFLFYLFSRIEAKEGKGAAYTLILQKEKEVEE